MDNITFYNSKELEALKSSSRKRRRPIVLLEAFFVRHRTKVMWVHIGMFLFFLALLFLPPLLPEAAADATPLTHFTELANYLIWGLWFPLVFISVIFTGRSWCGLLCPMGAASEWANRHGPQLTIPTWLRWEGTPVVSFMIITILGQTVGVRDHPEAIAEVFGATLLTAILIGYLFGRKKRAWCRHACPIGLLLGVYSRLSAVQFIPKVRAKVRAKIRKTAASEGYTEKGICPTMIHIPSKKESRHCIECFRCVNPEGKGGLKLEGRTPGDEIRNIRDHNPNITEVWFLFLGSGAALGGFLWLVLPVYQTLRQQVGEWFIQHGWYWIATSGPWWLMSVHPERREVFFWLDFFMIVGFILAVTAILTLLLFSTTSLSAWLAGVMGGDKRFRDRFTELGYQYAPVAMVSLVLGLGAALFGPLQHLGLEPIHIAYIKASLFIPSLLWSLYLGERILARQGVALKQRWLPLLPGVAGSLIIAMAWYPALF